MERHYKDDPTPEETLEYIAEAIESLREETWTRLYEECKGNPEARVTPEAVSEAITLRDVERRVAEAMAAKDEAFSSDYRHEATPAHSICYRILGSTVGINCQIWDLQKAAKS